MSIGSMLFNLIIGPLKLLFEFIFALANRLGNPGLSIIVLSLCMNILVLPLYRRADKIQDEEREAEARMAPVVAHIKKTFHGDQQFMTLQTYYRQNHYSQAHALKGLLPLMLEIPFFIAAYQFLSGLDLLNHAGFGPIQDLGAPDALIAIGSIRINFLPILMTAVNLLSGAIYTRGAPLKSKLQLYAMALVFLVLLYRSPAGLTMYWTLNNLFALGKNIILRIPRKERAPRSVHYPAFMEKKPRPAMFFAAAAFIALLTGALIPSAVIVSSPSEFVDVNSPLHPIWYVINSMLLSTGTFVIWFGIYYLLGTDRMKRGMELAVWVLAGLMLINYLGFHRNFGILSSVLQFEEVPLFTAKEKLINLAAMAIGACALTILFLKWERGIGTVCMVAALTVTVMTAVNGVQAQPMIQASFSAIENNEQDEIQIPISRTGKNVIVFMLDRAISRYVPCIFAEDPELLSAYDGFTWYSNTLSHGAFTNFGTPGLFGGYEYTPWESNQRTDMTIPEKHDEALMMMPRLFGEADYQVTVIDPPYAGSYAFVPDLSIYDQLKNVKAYRAINEYDYNSSTEGKQHLRFRNFFAYALCEVSPWIVYGTLYNAGFYNENDAILTQQVRKNMSVAEGLNGVFLAYEGVFSHLPEMTSIQEGEVNTLLVMDSEITHQPQLLQAPEYKAAYYVDNTEYDHAHADRFTAGPEPLSVTETDQMMHYHVNMAAFKMLGEWLRYLQENDLYDNTRIILVSDHGFGLELMEDQTMKDGEDLLFYNALLMVKDFGSHGELKWDETFMTNADVPTLATQGLIEHPVNPFTGKEIDGNLWKSQKQKVTFSHDWSTSTNNKTTFSVNKWYEVEDTVLDPEKWSYLGEY